MAGEGVCVAGEAVFVTARAVCGWGGCLCVTGVAFIFPCLHTCSSRLICFHQVSI